MEKNKSKAGMLKDIFIVYGRICGNFRPEEYMCGIFRTKAEAASAVAEEAWATYRPDAVATGDKEKAKAMISRKLYQKGRIEAVDAAHWIEKIPFGQWLC